MTDNPPITDPRDDVRGRARVTDTPELHAFYDELAKHNAGAFWKRANAIEPWEPETRYRPTLWRYADMRAMCLRAIDLVKPEEAGRRVRSEEHTSELQSLMRISYAVFCLKTKKKQTTKID